MDEREWLAERFEEHRTRLRAVAYRMLGSLSEADDAVQEAWLRLNRADASELDNLGGWLTTVVARISLNMLRSRKTRREEPLAERLPDPLVDRVDGIDPEHDALLADSVGSRCSSCSRRCLRRSGWRSCCTTSLPSPSTRSRR
jgi:RNA polymerase sigma-70 factor (ECF subfamily)